MKSLSRVVWSEGMHLAPHHFQAQNRYFEDSMQFAIDSLWPYAYGLLGWQIDADALANGTLSLIHARGIFPDGLSFQMPESDVLPQARDIADAFPPTRESVIVLLAVQPRRQGKPNCAMSSAELTDNPRYIAELHPVSDENNGSDEKPVRIGRKNIRLLLDSEPAEDLTVLPIARVLRSTSGQFILDPCFIPPCLQISASNRILAILQRLIEIMEEKSKSLAASRSGREASAGYSTREIASFWFLHAVNSSLNVFRHQWSSKHGHPEELYTEMLRLGGALCTFTLDSHPRSLPAYDHARLDHCFDALDQHIREHLELLIPTNCITIPLKKIQNYYFAGAISDSRCFGRSRWIFAIRSAIGHGELISKTPQLIKICSQKFIEELVKRGIAGLILTHVPVPPAAIPARVETQYFELTKSGACWNTLVDTKAVGVYVPGEFPQPELELLVVLDT